MNLNNPEHRELVELLMRKLADIYYPALLLMYGEKSHHLSKLREQLEFLGLLRWDDYE